MKLRANPVIKFKANRIIAAPNKFTSIILHFSHWYVNAVVSQSMRYRFLLLLLLPTLVQLLLLVLTSFVVRPQLMDGRFSEIVNC